jgi:hypothetical protein
MHGQKNIKTYSLVVSTVCYVTISNYRSQHVNVSERVNE